MPTQFTAAIYGAVLSTFVFAWQLWRAWSERHRLTASYVFRGIDDPGNDILLINNSPKPMTVYRLDLFWGERRFGVIRRFARAGNDPWGFDDDPDTGITLAPFEIAKLNYSGERYFAWPYGRRPRARLYLNLRIVGRRRSSTLLIYKPWSRVSAWVEWLGTKLGYMHYIDEASMVDVLAEDLEESLTRPRSGPSRS